MNITEYKKLSPANIISDITHTQTTIATKYNQDLIDTLNLRCKEADDLSASCLACNPIVSPTRITYRWTVVLGLLIPKLAELVASNPNKQYYFRRFAIPTNGEIQPFVVQSFERALAFPGSHDTNNPDLSDNTQFYLTQFYATINRLFNGLYASSISPSGDFSTEKTHLDLNAFQSLHLIAAIDLLHQKEYGLHCNVPGGTLNVNTAPFPCLQELETKYGIILDRELPDFDIDIANVICRNDISVTKKGIERTKKASEPWLQYWKWDLLTAPKTNITIPGFAGVNAVRSGYSSNITGSVYKDLEMITLTTKQPKQNIRVKMKHYITKFMYMNYAGFITRIHPTK